MRREGVKEAALQPGLHEILLNFDSRFKISHMGARLHHLSKDLISDDIVSLQGAKAIGRAAMSRTFRQKVISRLLMSFMCTGVVRITYGIHRVALHLLLGVGNKNDRRSHSLSVHERSTGTT